MRHDLCGVFETTELCAVDSPRRDLTYAWLDFGIDVGVFSQAETDGYIECNIRTVCRASLKDVGSEGRVPAVCCLILHRGMEFGNVSCADDALDDAIDDTEPFGLDKKPSR